jgi:hypothetical protein
MVAQIHQGEMVVPQDFASGLRASSQIGSLGGGGINYSPSVNMSGASTITAAELSSALSASNRQLYSYLSNISRNGGMTIPGRGLTR